MVQGQPWWMDGYRSVAHARRLQNHHGSSAPMTWQPYNQCYGQDTANGGDYKASQWRANLEAEAPVALSEGTAWTRKHCNAANTAKNCCKACRLRRYFVKPSDPVQNVESGSRCRSSSSASAATEEPPHGAILLFNRVIRFVGYTQPVQVYDF